ncbi:MAG: hypothetical protein WEC75_05295 [Dehalococcoidia bacterium]
MEYVQTVLFRIAAARTDEAAGLLKELEDHRGALTGRAGFRGLRINRSANPEGDALVVVETRWSDNNSLADYSASEPNVATVVAKHGDAIIADSLKVERMQPVAGESGDAATVYPRLALALFVPIGVLAFSLLTIYLLSRIYLVIPNEAATVMAALVALGILGLSAYLAAHPRIPQWQIAAIVGAIVLALSGGGIYAAVVDDDEEAHVAPTPPPNGGPGGPPLIILHDNYFEAAGEQNPTVPVPTGQEVTIDLRNEGTAIHNVHVSVDGEYPSALCQTGGEAPCSDPARIAGGAEGTITFTLAAGSYEFRCDFHPTEMTGTFDVR